MTLISKRIISKIIDILEPGVIAGLIWYFLTSRGDYSVSYTDLFFVLYTMNTVIFVLSFKNATLGDKIAGIKSGANNYVSVRIITRELWVIFTVFLGLYETYHFVALTLFLLPTSFRSRHGHQLVIDVMLGLKCRSATQNMDV